MLLVFDMKITNTNRTRGAIGRLVYTEHPIQLIVRSQTTTTHHPEHQ